MGYGQRTKDYGPLIMPRFLHSRLAWALLLLTPAAVLSLRGADEPNKKETVNPALKAATALYDGVRVVTLDNGLRVYLKPVPGSPSSPRWSPTRSARPTKISTTPACRTISNT